MENGKFSLMEVHTALLVATRHSISHFAQDGVNVLEGLELYAEILTKEEESMLLDATLRLLDHGREGRLEGQAHLAESLSMCLTVPSRSSIL